MRELIIDSFAGGGGASTGIEMALGRSPDIAINHDATALAMHRINHPDTLHIIEDVWHVDFKSICAGRPIGLLWLSPDCTHFSKAKGGKPREKALRGLAWVSLKWVKSLSAWQRPRVIMLENVEEFGDWGPLTEDGKPCKKQKGLFFRQFKESFAAMGYAVEARPSRAYEGLAPTIRRRLLVIMRRDGEPIVWPEALAGDPNSEAVKSKQIKPWLDAAACIDFSLPCPSIFASVAEIKAEHGIRAKRPLAEATLARVAKGVKRYVLDASKPFMVNLTHGGRVESAGEPFRTVTGANRGEKALVAPSLISVAHGYSGGRREYPISDPFGTMTSGGISHAVTQAQLMPFISRQFGASVGHALHAPLATVTANGGGKSALVAPYLLSLKSSARRDSSALAPHPTVCAGGLHSALVTPFLTKFRANAIGSAITAPVPTVTANSWLKKPGGAVPIGLITPVLTAAQHGGSVRSVAVPVQTITASTKDQNAVIVPHLMTMRNSQKPFNGANEPTHTITAGGAGLSCVSAFLVKNYTGVVGSSLAQPIGSITSVDHHSLAAPFLVKYYGTAEGQKIAEPMHSATAKARFGFAWPMLSPPPLTPAQEERARAVAIFLREHDCWDGGEFVTVDLAGEIYVMVDIGLRMLTPRELFRAQGFPESYIIDRGIDAEGREIKLSNTAQIEKCGNSVSPPWAAWHIRPNFEPRDVKVPAPADDAGTLFEGVAA